MRTVALFFLLTTGTLRAQIPIDTLRITVARDSTSLQNTPASVSVLTGEEIAAGKPAISLDEALSRVPGLFINNRYNFALGTRLSLRGFGARAAFGVRGIRIIADGIPLTTADGQSNLNNIDLTSVARIEVLRGAASALHGNAAGGVIQFESFVPEPGFASEGQVSASSLGMTRVNANLGGGSEATRFSAALAHTRGDGFREHARFEQTNLSARIAHTFSATARTTLTFSLADAPVAQNPGSLPRDSAQLRPAMAWPRNVATGAGETSRQMQAGVQHQQRIGTGTLTASLYGVARTLENPLPFAFITLDRKAGGARTTFQTGPFTLGFDAEMQTDAREEFDNVAGGRGTHRRNQTDRTGTIAPFARLNANFTSKLSGTAALRYDRTHFRVDDDFLADGRDDSGELTLSAVSPSAALSYAAAAHTTLFATVSTAFQTPTTTELINTPPPPGEPCCPAGFNKLEPERALAFELGMRSRLHERLRVEAALYHMIIRDELIAYQLPQVEGRDFFRNEGRTRHRGAELGVTAVLNEWAAVTASYTWNDFVFLGDLKGKRLPGVTPHHIFLLATLSNRAFSLEPEIESVAGYFADNANTDAARVRGYTVANLRARLTRIGGTGAELFAGVNNLLDESYSSSAVINAAGARFFEPAPGRNSYLGVRIGTARPR